MGIRTTGPQNAFPERSSRRPFWGAVSPLSKPLSSASVGTLLMFQCATVVRLIFFLLVMSKSDPAPLTPVRTYLVCSVSLYL